MGEKAVDLEGVNPKFKNSSQNKIIIALLLALVSLAAVAVALAVVVIHDNKDDKADNKVLPQVSAEQHGSQQSNLPATPQPGKPKLQEDICMTEDCVKAAATIIDSIDPTVDPCDDFYTYSCGGWEKLHVIPEDKSSTGVFNIIRDDVDIILKNLLQNEIEPTEIEAVKKAKRLMKSCENLDEIEKTSMGKAKRWLEGFGGWPVLGSKEGGKWNSAAYNFTNLMIALRRYSNSAPILDSYVYDDSKDSEKNILYVDQPSFGMPSRDYLLKESNDTMLQAYINYAVNVAVLFGAKKENAEEEMKQMVDFEIMLANLSMPSDERRDAEKLYNKMTITQLKTNSPKFDWILYFNSILGMDGVGLQINDSENLIVSNPNYANKVFDIVDKTQPKTVANYMCWRAVLWMISGLPERVRAANLEYKKVLIGSGTEPPRWKTCASETNGNFGLAVGKLFIKDAFDLDAKDTVSKMIETLRSSMEQLLENNDWMDSQTKDVAVDKAKAIEPRIGFPDEIQDDDFLNDKYKRYDISEDNYFANSENLMLTGTVENLKKLREPVDREKWDTPPATVNAYYNPPRNQIMFPAGILQPPFFKNSHPKYLNYGGIGYVIGHEMTHGFDDNGREYDKTGALKQWWSEKSIEQFKGRAQCIIDQYGNFTVPVVNMKLNGHLTLGENIADNGGIKESWNAYQKWIEESNDGKPEPLLPGLNYTQQQLFYLNSAHVWCGLMRPQEAIRRIRTDPHSNYRFRVFGPLQNNPGFSEAFNCAKGTFMNPVDKCVIW